jgi:hypothetical protein
LDAARPDARPDSGVAAPGTGGPTGLKGEYFDNMDFTNLKTTRIDPVVDFNWADGLTGPTLVPDQFSVRWTDQVGGCIRRPTRS